MYVRGRSRYSRWLKIAKVWELLVIDPATEYIGRQVPSTIPSNIIDTVYYRTDIV